MIAHAWQILVVTFAGWLNRQQQDVVEYLQEENRVLREHLKGRRIHFTDDQRRRLAVKGKALGRRALMGIEALVTLETILRWYRQLIAKKYDGSGRGGSRATRKAEEWSEELDCILIGLQGPAILTEATVHQAPLLSREGAFKCPGTAIGLSERPTTVVGATPSGKPRFLALLNLGGKK